MNRIIFHVDVNNAFLSWSAIYLLENGYKRDIRLIPAVIAGDEKKRHGVVVAKSTIAKQYGVKSAEALYLARKKCPNLEVFAPNYPYYQEKSRLFYQYLLQYTPLVERASIDECYMDLTGTKYLYDDILLLAHKIKKEIKDLYGFTVNVGVANNKLCAKMASDFEKPDKVHTLFDYEISSKMWPLPVDSLLYIGKSTTSILHSIKINTIGELAKADVKILNKHFKNRGIDLINAANGIDNSKVIPDYGLNKSISIIRTFEEDTNDISIIKMQLLKMSNTLGIRLRKNNQYAKTIAITVKTSSFKTYSHQEKMVNVIDNTMDIYHYVMKLYNAVEIKEKIRSIGIRLDNLSICNNEQVSFFNENKQDKSLQKLMDDINVKYQDNMIMPAIFYTNDKQ